MRLASLVSSDVTVITSTLTLWEDLRTGAGVHRDDGGGGGGGGGRAEPVLGGQGRPRCSRTHTHVHRILRNAHRVGTRAAYAQHAMHYKHALSLGAAALEFYKQAFGAVVQKLTLAGDGRVLHSALQIGRTARSARRAIPLDSCAHTCMHMHH